MQRTAEELDTRQMPCRSSVTSEKNYCDLLYAWIQCNSERTSLHSQDRRISKKKCKYTNIEREMTDSQGEKVMDRRTISKYFQWLVTQGYLVLDEKQEYYNITVLEKGEANIIYYKTLSILMNVFRRHSIDIYQYLYSRYCANGKKTFRAAIPDIKRYIGITTSTSSNNAVVMDTVDILKRLGLLDYQYVQTDENKTMVEFLWVTDRLSEEGCAEISNN